MTGFDEYERAGWNDDRLADTAARLRDAIEEALIILEWPGNGAVERACVLLQSAIDG